MRILRRALVPLAFLVLAVLGQVTIVNRLPLPGDAGPDLVLLVVAALAVTGGPVPGMLAGFVGGLALDLAPPVSDLAGETAFVFCAAGYACGVLAMQLSPQKANSRNGTDTWTSTPGTRDRGLPVLASLPVMVAGVGLAEALRAGLGLMLSDPRMTGPAITHVLPAAVVYDILFCPFALWLVAAAMGAAEPATAVLGASEPRQPQPGRAVVRAAGVAGGIRAGKAAAVPRLTFADTRQGPLRAPVPPPPKLKFGTGTANSLARPVTNTVPSLRSRSLPGSHPVRVNFDSAGRGGVIGGRGPRGSQPGGGFGSGLPGLGGGGFSGALGPSLFAGAGRRSTRKPRRNWLSASGRYSVRSLAGNARVTSGGTGVRLLAGYSARSGGAPAVPGALRSPGKGWLQSGKRGKPPGRSNPGRKPASPGDGWIRGRGALASARWAKSASWSSGSPGHRSSPGKGWIRPAKPVPPARRKSPGRGWLERKPARIMWQPKSPGKGWLGRGSGPRRSGLRVQGMRAKTLGSGRTRIGGRR
jgi:rod shape-determining protein MreD